MVGWMSRHNCRDDANRHGSPESYLVDLYSDEYPLMRDMGDDEALEFVTANPYPGVLLSLYQMETGGDVRFEVRSLPCPRPHLIPSWQQGFVAITPSEANNEQLGALPPSDLVADQVNAMLRETTGSEGFHMVSQIIASEIKAWKDYVNGDVYILELVQTSQCGVAGCEDTHDHSIDQIGGVYVGLGNVVDKLDEMLPWHFGEGDYLGTWQNEGADFLL